MTIFAHYDRSGRFLQDVRIPANGTFGEQAMRAVYRLAGIDYYADRVEGMAGSWEIRTVSTNEVIGYLDIV